MTIDHKHEMEQAQKVIRHYTSLMEAMKRTDAAIYGGEKYKALRLQLYQSKISAYEWKYRYHRSMSEKVLS